MATKRKTSVEHRDAEGGGLELNLDLIGIIRRRFHHITVGMLLGVTAATIYSLRQEPLYESKLSVLVGQRSSELASTGVRDTDDGAVTLQDKLLSTHIELFRSPKILARASEEHQLSQGAGELLGGLEVKKSPNASILIASYQHSDPQVAATTLQAIFETYHQYVENQSRTVGVDAAKLIAEAQAENERDLRQADREYREFVASVPALMDASGRSDDVHRKRLDTIESELAGVRRALSEARSRSEAIGETIERVAPEELSDALVMTLLREEDISRLNAVIQLDERRKSIVQKDESIDSILKRQSKQAEFQRLMDLSGQREVMLSSLGQDHPAVEALETQMRNVRDHVQRYQLPAEGASKAAGRSPAFDMPPAQILTTYYDVLKSDIEQLIKRESELMKLSAEEAKLAKQVELSVLEGASLKANLERAQTRYDEVFKRLQELNLTNGYSGFSTDLLVTPKAAGAPFWPDRRKIALSGLLAGGLLGFAFAFVGELMDRTFRNPDEVEEVFHAPILAHLPHLSKRRLAKQVDGESAISPIVTAFHQPECMDAETLKSMRTSILILARRESKKVFLVTSPSPGDGKSTSIANLAVSMAQAGKRVLLVDADMRRPVLDCMFGVQRAPGLSEFLRGAHPMAECLHECEQENLMLCPAGDRTSVPSELLESELFEEFIRQARETFDLVFLDAPPVLAVTDPTIIAMHVDGCLLTTRIEKNNRPIAEHAACVLQDHFVSVDGIIVNARHSRGGGYAYAAYDYTCNVDLGYVGNYRRYYDVTEETTLDPGVSRQRLNTVERQDPPHDGWGAAEARAAHASRESGETHSG